MRFRVWSSDVCSSGLLLQTLDIKGKARHSGFAQWHVEHAKHAAFARNDRGRGADQRALFLLRLRRRIAWSDLPQIVEKLGPARDRIRRTCRLDRRSEERRVGQGGVSTGRDRGSAYN